MDRVAFMQALKDCWDAMEETEEPYCPYCGCDMILEDDLLDLRCGACGALVGRVIPISEEQGTK